uniref:Putative ovule protein n=1 Tax=Solanum chacoense TaxID=4108 RepID=A0A0V0I2U2_SOLCH
MLFKMFVDFSLFQTQRTLMYFTISYPFSSLKFSSLSFQFFPPFFFPKRNQNPPLHNESKPLYRREN